MGVVKQWGTTTHQRVRHCRYPGHPARRAHADADMGGGEKAPTSTFGVATMCASTAASTGDSQCRDRRRHYEIVVAVRLRDGERLRLPAEEVR